MARDESSVSVRLSILEHDMDRANTTLDKIQSDAERHREAHTQITEKIYERMEELRSELKEDIQTLKSDIQSQIESQNKILNKINDKLESFDKWRWMIVGMATVAGFILSKVTTLFGVTIK
jgi:archaellum component FlaC